MKAPFGQIPRRDSYASTVLGGNTLAEIGTSPKMCQPRLQQYCLWIATGLSGPASTERPFISSRDQGDLNRRAHSPATRHRSLKRRTARYGWGGGGGKNRAIKKPVRV